MASFRPHRFVPAALLLAAAIASLTLVADAGAKPRPPIVRHARWRYSGRAISDLLPSLDGQFRDGARATQGVAPSATGLLELRGGVLQRLNDRRAALSQHPSILVQDRLTEARERHRRVAGVEPRRVELVPEPLPAREPRPEKGALGPDERRVGRPRSPALPRTSLERGIRA